MWSTVEHLTVSSKLLVEVFKKRKKEIDIKGAISRFKHVRSQRFILGELSRCVELIQKLSQTFALLCVAV